MKIIQIIPYFGVAGAEIMCENLVYALKDKNAEVLVISLFDKKSPITERLEKSNIKIYYLGKKKGLDFSMVRKLKKIFREERPDVIHTHLNTLKYAIPAAILSKVRIRVHTIHSVAKKENGFLDRKVNKFFFKWCSVVPVALSAEVQKTIVNEYHLKSKQVPIISNGVNLIRCRVKNNYEFENEEIQVLHVGRFSEVKNHRMLIDGIYELSKKHNIRLKLVGEGELRDEIEKQVSAYGLSEKVDFLGLTDNVFDLFYNADIFVLPSLYEGTPMTLIEAMGCAVPIVASRVGGIVDMIEDGVDGLLCEPTSCDIVAKIECIIGSIGFREKMAISAQNKSRIYSVENTANSYLKIYEGYRE